MNIDTLLDKLWRQYRERNPQVDAIHRLLAARGEAVVNDHIALRTFDDPRVNINVVARAFVAAGYRPAGDYTFPAKHLVAEHYEHENEALPRVFISELQLSTLSRRGRAIVDGLLGQLQPDMTARPDFPASGRPWRITWDDYEALRAESEYAAWVGAFGFCANHFTVDVNRLTTFVSLEALNRFLKDEGFALNDSGGEIKGSPDQLLEQSSTLADEVEVDFAGETRRVPCCYYEFARRYLDANGRLFGGFIAKSADRIFESTDRR